MAIWTIYLLRDPADPTRGYVGQTRQGIEKRIRGHLTSARSGGGSAVQKWIAEILARGQTPLVAALDVASSLDEANEKEQKWIRWARKGLGLVMLNRRRGGQAPFDAEAHASAVRLHLADPANRAEHLRRLNTPAAKANRAIGLRAANQRPDRRQASADQSRARWANPEYRNRLKEKISKAASTPAAKRQRSAEMKARWADPAFREKCERALESARSTLEWKERHKTAIRKRFVDPDEKARILSDLQACRWSSDAREEQSAKMRALWADPEWSHRQQARMRVGRVRHTVGA